MDTYEGFWSSFDSISSKVTIFAMLGRLGTRNHQRERLLSFGVRSGRRVQERLEGDALMGRLLYWARPLDEGVSPGGLIPAQRGVLL